MKNKGQAKRLTEGSLLKFLPSAMISAAKSVTKVSGEWLCPWEGAEYQYGTHITNKLWKTYPCSILCEYLASDTVQEALQENQKNSYLGDEKHDLTVINNRKRIVALIEIKRRVWQYKEKMLGIQYDLKKMSKVINASGDDGVGLGFSVFMFGYSLPDGDKTSISGAKSAIEERFNDEFLERAKGDFGNFRIKGHLHNFPKPFCWDDDDSNEHTEVWTAGAISIARK